MERDEVIDYFQRLHKKGEHLCVIVWSADDVIGRANELGEKCSKEEAYKILDAMERQHDATIGVTWDTIDAHLIDLNEEHEKQKAERKRKEKIKID
jgi:uncharacterized protein YwlG (UPF0340 family)